jgi:hypothetical protein
MDKVMRSLVKFAPEQAGRRDAVAGGGQQLAGTMLRVNQIKRTRAVRDPDGSSGPGAPIGRTRRR